MLTNINLNKFTTLLGEVNKRKNPFDDSNQSNKKSTIPIEKEDWFDTDKIKNHEEYITIDYNNWKMLDSNNKYHLLTNNLNLPRDIKEGIQSETTSWSKKKLKHQQKHSLKLFMKLINMKMTLCRDGINCQKIRRE